MKTKTIISALALTTAFSWQAALAQSSPGYEVPRTEHGQPDLQGFWTNISITTLSRPRGADKLTVTPAEAVEGAEFVLTCVGERRPAPERGAIPHAQQDVAGRN